MASKPTFHKSETEEATCWVGFARTSTATRQPKFEGRPIGGRVFVHRADFYHQLAWIAVFIHHRAVVLRERRVIVIDVSQRDDKRANASLRGIA